MKQCLLIIGVILAYLSSFADGKYWINQDVEKIIKHDNYIEVAKGNEKKDDVVMYSSDDHKYDHSMKILEITNDGIWVYGQDGQDIKNHKNKIEEECSEDYVIYRKSEINN